MPIELYGEWELGSTHDAGLGNGVAVRPTVVLNFNAPALVRGPDGTAVEWLGRAVDYQPGPGGNPIGYVTVRAAGPFGEGRYAVWLFEGLYTGFDLGTVVLADPVDAFADRVARLVGPTPARCIAMRLGCHVWRRPGESSIAEASASFAEPFGYMWPDLRYEGAVIQVWRWGTKGGL